MTSTMDISIEEYRKDYEPMIKSHPWLATKGNPEWTREQLMGTAELEVGLFTFLSDAGDSSWKTAC